MSKSVKKRATMITTACAMLGYTVGEMAEAFEYILSHIDDFIASKPSKGGKE